ncbi:MAG: SUMF1/EgtB/PvdO family nonheme iron enzyme, partial [Pseudomonadota bacterium]
ANARVPGLGLRLPSEAEWEYACRAGTETATYAGTMEFEDTHDAPVLDAIAWYGGNSGADWDLEVGDPVHWSWKAHAFDEAGTRRVRQKRPNPWGFHDMLGNVWEWCADDWSDSYDGASPDGAPREIPEGPSRWDRVIRGGNWRNPARGVRSAFRGRSGDKAGSDDLGFRCVQGQVVSPGGPEGRGS